MKRAELTEKILDIKREKGWTWKHITDEIGGMSPVLVVGALLGQMKLPKPLAEKAASLFGLSEPEKRMLNEVPTRGTPMPPTDPLLYRFYEMVMVNGPALKALTRPACESERRPRADGDVRQVFALQILRCRAGPAGIRVQGRVRQCELWCSELPCSR
jgi:cyanate lyase